MAAAIGQSRPVKKLKEHLQEKQEPFILDIYLLERGYFTNSFRSRKSLKRSATCSKLLRAVYSTLGIRSSGHRNEIVVTDIKGRNNQEAGELDRFSSSSSSTVFNSCTGSDEEETSTSQHKDPEFRANTSQSVILCNPIEKEAAADRKHRWQFVEESRQLSPVSVVLEAASYRDEPKGFTVIKETNPSKSSVLFPKKVAQDSILSASLWKVLIQSANEKKQTLPRVSEIQEHVQSNNNNNLSSQYLKSKTGLQQTRQLLFDCVREIVENQGRKTQHQLQRKYLASEELGKPTIRDKIKCWRKQSAGESNLAELLESELMDSAQEWSDFEPQRRRIGFEIGNAIFEDMRTEIVTDMADFLSPINGC